jgi:hypothetical protein
LRLVERATGEPITVVARSASGADLSLDDLAIVDNGGWAPNKGKRRTAARRTSD